MFRLFMGALIGASLSACVPSVYSPNQLQTPMLREAGQFQATLGNGNATAAVAVTDHVGLHGGAYYDEGGLTGRDGRQTATKWLAEGGLGVGGNFGLEDLRWEVLAGGGGGRSWAFTDNDPDGRSFDTNLVRGYVQPNLGFVTPFVEVIASARLSGLRFMDFSSTGYTGPNNWGLTEENATGRTWLFLEPSVTVKVGYRWVKLFVQPVWTLKLNPEELQHRQFNLYVGLSFDIGKWHGNWKFGG